MFKICTFQQKNFNSPSHHVAKSPTSKGELLPADFKTTHVAVGKIEIPDGDGSSISFAPPKLLNVPQQPNQEQPNQLLFGNSQNLSLSASDPVNHLFNEKVRRIEKCIAIKKGRAERNLKVTTHQMESLLKNRLEGIERSKLKEISLILSREINEMMENKEKYIGKNNQLKPHEKTYPYHSLEIGEAIKLPLSLPFYCWLELNEQLNEVELFILPPGLNKIGQGANKIVSRAECFQIQFKVDPNPVRKVPGLKNQPDIFIYERKGTFTPKVLIEPRCDDPLRKRESIMQIDREISIIDCLKTHLPQSVELISQIKKTKPFVDDVGDTPLFSQDWYHSDLEKINRLRVIPLDFSKDAGLLKIDESDILRIIIDVATTLEGLHNINRVHHDVKPQNIFVKMHDDKTHIKGVLADFDMTHIPGVKSLSNNDDYPFWDSLCNQGFITPFTDVYGLTVSLATAVIPGFKNLILRSLQSKENREKLFLEVIQSRFSTKKDLPIGCNNAFLIKWYESSLEQTIQIQVTPQKERLQQALNNLRVLKSVIDLLGDVIQIDQKVFSSVSLTLSPVLKFLNRGLNLNSSKEQDECLVLEIETEFNLEESIFKDFVSSKITDWNELTDSRKILEVKSRLNQCLFDETLNSSLKQELQSLLKKIEAREGALEYIGRLCQKSEEECADHPLVDILILPKIINSPEIYQQYIEKEILSLKYSPEIRTLLRKNLVGKDSKGTPQQVLKNKLLNILNFSQDPKIKKESLSLVNQISVIERALDFAIEMGNVYKSKVNSVMDKALTMKELKSRLIEIKRNFATH